MVFEPSLRTEDSDATAMSLACGEIGQPVQNFKRFAKNLTTSCCWVGYGNVSDTGAPLQDALTENLLALRNPYDFQGMKRQRLSKDAVSRENPSSFEKDGGLLLGLGRMASEVNTESRASTGRIFMKGTDEEPLPMELELGLSGRVSDGLMNNCMPPVVSGGRSALTSVDADVDIPSNVHCDSDVMVNPLLGLGRLQCSVVRATGSDGGRGNESILGRCNSFENNASLHGPQSNSSLLIRSDSVSGTSYGSGYGGQYLDVRSDNSCIRVDDEGSTSARINCGGYMSSLLMAPRIDSVASCAASIGRLGIDLVNDIDVSESETFMNFRQSTSTTSNVGAPAGLADRAPKTCMFRGCSKGARGASGLCIAHGGGRRCQKQGCNKGAEGRTVYCKAHGGGRRCESLGCTKSAEGKTDYCIGHGGGRRCTHDGCSKAARGKSGLCIRHGGGKRCQKEGCTKSAEGYSGLCISHGGGRRCQFPDCGKGAQGSTMLCKAHGGGKRCMIQGCNKGAEGSTPLCKGHGGGKRCMFEGGGICTKSVHGATAFCVAHGGGKRCAVQECTKSARGRTDFCVRHGGGKRCKFEQCTKSAQGSTDFCKAHGGGKRCSWGQEDSPYRKDLIPDLEADLLKGPCDRFARGKLGLCASHSALVHDRRVHGASTIGHALGPGIGPGLFCGLVSGSGSERRGSKNHSMSNAVRDAEKSPDCQRSDLLKQTSLSYESTEEEGSDMEYGSNQEQGSKTPPWKTGPSENLTFKSCNLNTLDMEEERSPTSLNPFQLTMDVPTEKTTSSNLTPTIRSLETPEMGSSWDANSMSCWPVLPPQVLVPVSMQKEDSPPARIKRYSGQKSRAKAGNDGTFNMSSLSLPEERVHGGKIMSV